MIRTLIKNGMPVTTACLRSGRLFAKQALSQVSSRLHKEVCSSFWSGGAEEVTTAFDIARRPSEDVRFFDEWTEELKRTVIVWAIQSRCNTILAQLPSESRQLSSGNRSEPIDRVEF